MKFGFTTGSAATAATKAALMYLITLEKNNISIVTPSGENYIPEVFGYECSRQSCNSLKAGDSASCYVIKESGDDPDITAGMEIYATVTLTECRDVFITGGEGIGVVTRTGLDQKVGEYAINSTPRKTITEEVNNLIDEYDIEYGVTVKIAAPRGVEISKKTFNPHMGIEGGISIIGTSGIVKPMSTEALLDTIKLDINMQYSEGKTRCVIVPGNYGVTFLENNYAMNEKDIVLCSNFVGDSIRFAVDIGFKHILFCSHIGKMIKVSGGVMNTHSMYGDRRMELMLEAFLEANNKDMESEDVKAISERILNCVSTTAALNVLEEFNVVKKVSEVIVEKTKKELEKVCSGKAIVDVILYENSYGELARSF